jgi:hypothetical protein
MSASLLSNKEFREIMDRDDLSPVEKNAMLQLAEKQKDQNFKKFAVVFRNILFVIIVGVILMQMF